MKLEKGQDILKVRGSILADRKPMWKARGRGRKRKEDDRQDRKLGGSGSISGTARMSDDLVKRE